MSTSNGNLIILELNKDLVEACGDVDAGLLITYFQGCQLRQQLEYAAALRTAAEAREVPPKPYTLLPKTITQIHADCLGILSKQRIRIAIRELIKKGILAAHRNPDAKQQLDQTRFYEVRTSSFIN